MEPFYIPTDEFWDWFDRDPTKDAQAPLVTKQSYGMTRTHPTIKGNNPGMPIDHDSRDMHEIPSYSKKMKTRETKPRHICETMASAKPGKRYVVLYGKHRPGKKNKVWEGDGYLSIVDGIAHLCDLKGRMVEEPTVLDDVDMRLIEDQSDIMIGNTEVQIVEKEKY